MKIQTTRDSLLNKILFVSKAISPKVSNFILSGIMLETNETELNIYGTDLETNIKSSIKVKVEKSGRVVVPSRILVNVLRSFPESKIDLELLNDTNELLVRCQKANFRLNTFSLEEFPQFPAINKKNSLKLKIEDIRYLVSKVQKACSTDESRIILTGVHINLSKDLIKLAATDSYRLSVSQNNITYKGEPTTVVVPSRVLDTVSKSEVTKGEIEINIEDNQISFKTSGENGLDTTIISRLLSGKFPDYEKLIPQSFNHNIVIEREKMLDVIKRISSISQDNIPVRIDIEKGRVTVSMNIREIGSSSEDFEVGYGEEKIQIAFNPEFLIDGLNTIEGDKIILSIVEPLKPIMIKSEKKDDVIYILMPIRIS
jgi:DNA polymerase-3 subunit beta